MQKRFVDYSLWFVVNLKSVNQNYRATIQKFEDLKIWQLACELSQKIYPLTFISPIARDFRF